MPTSPIVCAVDFAEPSDRALDHALALAKRFDAPVIAVHAWSLPAFAGPDSSFVFGPEVVGEITNELQSQLKKLLERHKESGVKLEGRLMVGAPVEAVIDAAQKANAQYIVISTHGRSGISHFVLGSVAERLVRLSPIPVIVVPLKA
jgi:universal stress protein A